MSRLARLLPPVAAARRSYSIFASKSRAGRFFTSAKSSKVIAQSTSKTTPATTTSNASNGGSSPTPDAGDPNPAEDVGPSLPQQPTGTAEFSVQNAQPPVPAPTMASPSIDFVPTRPHPIIKPNDLVLHQFFSLHRPFLLLNQPTTSLFESSPSEQPPTSGFSAPPSPLGTIDDPPVASAEADAEAARQLSRALVMNRVGNLSDWEGALARLGLNEEPTPTPPVSVEVYMDSTKRKRRKKMKKHKLKKRRRLQRAKRLRLGK